MKKRLTVLIFASFLLFQGASPWEGSAAVAPNGELPSTGFYIATNAFPRNTVVDITNIETGKSARVIVSNILTSPGLIAVVSREAAQIIGMKDGSVSRIRMVQPSDPMAYMRFSESMAVGAPKYDSGKTINEENLTADVYGDDTYKPSDAEKQVSPPTALGYVIDEPEWGGSGRLQIVDVPGFLVEPVEAFKEDTPVSFNSPDTEVEKDNKQPEPLEQKSNIAEQDKKSETAPGIQEPVYITEQPNKDIVKDVSTKTNEEPPLPFEKDASEFVTETPRKEVEKEVSPWQEKADVVTTPPSQPEKVEEPAKQPEAITQEPEKKPEAVTQEPAKQPEAVTQEPVKQPEKVEEPVKQPETVTQAPPEQIILVPKEAPPNPPKPSVYGLTDDIITRDVITMAPESPRPGFNYPVKTIPSLERGKYYVQVSTQPENLLENELRKIDSSFDPKVLKSADNSYHILVGPLNLGESAAVLARFKSIGYKNAFVRRG